MSQRYIGIPPRFEPNEGQTVLPPEEGGYGNWVGGHSIVFDPDEKRFYLFYRRRRPLGMGRGSHCFIAESTDGVTFNNIWEANKEQFDAESIEVGSLIKDPVTGMWRLYVSYEPIDGPWRVDLIEARHPKELDPVHHRTVMQPEDYGLEFVKDPRVYIVAGLYVVFVAVSSTKRWNEDESGVRHLVGRDATGLMTSPDGIYFRSFKYVFESGQGLPGEWGHFRARINSVVYLPPLYVGFFDAGSSTYDNYEEWAGVAYSHDLERWNRVSTDGPWVVSPHGSIRYIEALMVGDELWYYYEYTRPDGSHELRMNKAAL